jgi:hypothetical protein
MKILFVIDDRNRCYMEYEFTGVMSSPKRRAVEIELTPEQVEKLGIRKLGVDCGRDIMETIESISLTE